MKKQTPRGDRIASKVQTIVAEILRDKYSDDPLLAGVSLVGADAHGGLSFVRLYYYIPSSDIPRLYERRGGCRAERDRRGSCDNSWVAETQARLDAVTKTIRYELAARLNQKYTPEIKFEYDDTMDRAARIEELLKNL